MSRSQEGESSLNPSTSSPPEANQSTPPDAPDPNKPLPGQNQRLQIPTDVIEKLRLSVFGFDTMWVTSVENYQENGVVFKGNVRAKDPAAAYQKMKERLKVGVRWV